MTPIYYLSGNEHVMMVMSAIEDTLADIHPKSNHLATTAYHLEQINNKLINSCETQFLLNDFFYFLYYGEIKVTPKIWQQFDNYPEPNSTAVIESPMIDISQLQLSFGLQWQLHQCNKMPKDKKLEQLKQYHNKIFNPIELHKAYQLHPNGFVGIEVDKAIMTHKRVVYSDVEGTLPSPKIIVIRSI